MRLPRPASSHLAIPSAGSMGMAQPVHAPASGITAQDIWRVIRANLWLIVGLFVVSAVGGYLLNGWLLAHYPRYTSTILIQVRPLGEIPSVSGNDSGDIGVRDASSQSTELEQLSQAGMLTNKYFLSSILEDPNSEIRKTGWFKYYAANNHIEEAKEELLKQLEVYPRPNTRLIGVSMSTGSPADSLTIVKEVVSRHVQERTDSVLSLQIQQLRNLQDLINTYQRELTNTKLRIDQQNTIMAGYGVSGGNYQMSTLHVKLGVLSQQHSTALRDATEAENRLKAFTSEFEAGGTPLLLQDALNKSNQNSSSSRADELETLLKGAKEKFGEDNINVRQIRAQLESERAQAAERDAKRRDELAAGIRNSLATELTTTKFLLQKNEEDSKKLQDDLEAESRAELLLVGYKKTEDNLIKQLDKYEQQKRNLETTINTAKDGKNSLSTASIVGGGDLPDKAAFPRLPITMTVSVVLGLALALGIAFLREFTDTSVRSPRDIAKVGQLNLLGMIPHESEDPEAQAARLPLAIYEAPTSIIAEQFRQVRTRLQHSASLDTVRSLLITGTAPGDGKTTVACNLAAGLALNGRRILLVDANFRRPQIHAVLNIPNEVGFGDVLNSLDMFESAVRETEIPNLAVLPTGIKPANSTELLESQLLIDFIERALEEYDHVIFDSGPLLLVSETSALAPRVDGVVTVVRARGNSRGMLQRLRDQLRQLKAENLGVVLNAVRAQTGGYYAPMIKSYYAYQQTD
jgi:capsular exopolysaccharide synthesis family protein